MNPEVPVANGARDRRVVGLCLVLAAITFAVFGQTLQHQFVNFDDGDYVARNPIVAQGLTFKGLVWAFTRPHCGNWHPVTWLSHMLDCQIYGLDPGGHHFSNVVLHAGTAIALFLLLRRLTGALWRSAFVAAVFAIHPLRAESVAWVAERKDVLSGFFFMLTLLAYERYASRVGVRGSREAEFNAGGNLEPGDPSSADVRCPCPAAPSPGATLHAPRRVEAKRRQPRSTLFYALSLAFFALGIMSKPMLVTLPFVLLLLDYWPLRRLEQARAGLQNAPRSPSARALLRLALEKLPFLALSAGCSLATLLAQKSAMMSYESFPLAARLGAALSSCKVYLVQMVYPAGLAAFYPFVSHASAWNAGIAGLLLVAISAMAWIERHARPWLLMGWLWYLVMLLPVLGLVQVGGQAHADRYTYLPQIGIYVAATWLAADFAARWKVGRVPTGALMGVVVAVLMACAWKQTAYWKNSETLWRHALACTTGNEVAYVNLGHELFEQRRLDEVVSHYEKGLEVLPNDRQFHNNLANALREQGKLDEAIVHYERAVQIEPNLAEAQFNLGKALGLKGRPEEAIARYEISLRIDPNFLPARMSLGNVLLQQGKADRAAPQFEKAIVLRANNAGAHLNLGLCYAQMGRMEAAKSQYEQAFQIAPGDPGIQNNLAWRMATCPEGSLRDGSRAVDLAQQASARMGGDKPLVLRTLAAALAETGRFPEAAATAESAASLAEAQSIPALAKQIRFEADLYRAGKPFSSPERTH